jgi:hypothetical protein
MLQYYILMKIKNKMKDSNVEFEEWWEVIKEFCKKVGEESSLTQS